MNPPREVPAYTVRELQPRSSKYCVAVFVLNEDGKLHKQLERMRAVATDFDRHQIRHGHPRDEVQVGRLRSRCARSENREEARCGGLGHGGVDDHGGDARGRHAGDPGDIDGARLTLADLPATASEAGARVEDPSRFERVELTIGRLYVESAR